jgi:hypothetical protein
MPKEIERRAVAELIPYAGNAREHDAANIAGIAESIQTLGWTLPILVDDDGTIIAGHGRVLAAEKLGLTEIPVIVANPNWSEDDRRAYVIADNRLAETSTWNDEKLADELKMLLAADYKVSLTGFSDDALTALVNAATAPETPAESSDGVYSRKITAPVYTPSEQAPEVSELLDDTKTRALVEAIRAADLPADVAAFLEAAATRHTVFNFARIADFYAHAPADVQRLMEASALVIIDFGQAIEHGFVKLTKRLGELAAGAEAADA